MGLLTADRIRSDFEEQVRVGANDLSGSLEVEVAFSGSRPYVCNPVLDDYAAASKAEIRVVLVDDARVLCDTSGAPDFGRATGKARYSHEAAGYRIEERPVTKVLIGTISEVTAEPAPARIAIQYGRPLADVNETLDRLTLLLAGGVLAGTLLALLAGLAVARTAMRPVAELTAAASEIGRTRDPTRRIPHPVAQDEVAELARTLESMLHELDEARTEIEVILSRQRQFVADASHELRTPLTAVLANLEILAEQLEGDEAEAAEAALRSSQRMRRLVGDLLLLARADAGRVPRHEPTDLSQVVLEAAAELEPIAGEHRLTVEVEAAWIDGARDELHRLVSNLIENAIVHTPPGTPVRVAVRRDDGEVVLTVADDGPGIPEELQDRIFERFVRGARETGPGTGLGLSIVRAVALSHGGEVFVNSGVGACFEARLPAAQTSTTTGSTMGRRLNRS